MSAQLKDKVTRLVYEIKLLDIYKHCFFHILLSVLTCGIYYIIYGRTRITSYLVSQVSIDGAKVISIPNDSKDRAIRSLLEMGITLLFFTFFVYILSIFVLDNFWQGKNTLRASSFFAYLSFLSIKDFIKDIYEVLWNPMANSLLYAFGAIVLGSVTGLLRVLINIFNYAIIFSVLLQSMKILFIRDYNIAILSWRRIRLIILSSNIWKYYILSILSVFNCFTLGILSPIVDVKRKTYFWQSVYVNNNPVTIYCPIKPLIIENLKNLLWFAPTLGISRIWYWATLDRHIYNSIHIGDIKLKSKVEGVDLFFLYFFHILGTMFYAGIFIALSFIIPYKFDTFTTRILISTLLSIFITMPKIMHANMEFYTAYHYIVGDLNTLAKN